MFASTWRIIEQLRADRRQWVAALSTSWFWTVGIVALSLVPVIVKSRIGGGLDVEICVNLIFAAGVGAGSLAAAQLSHGRIELAPAPFLLLVDGGLLVDLRPRRPWGSRRPTREVPLAEFFASALGLRLAFDLFVFSAAAGLFVVPIFAAIQAWAGEDRRARVVGAVNALNYLMMVGGSLVTMILLQVVGLSEPAALVVLGLANFVAAIYVFRNLPANRLAFVARAALRLVYRLEVVGAENLPRPGECAAIAVNHVSFLDAAALTAIMEEPPLLAIDRAAAKRWPVEPLLNFAASEPIDPARALTAGRCRRGGARGPAARGLPGRTRGADPGRDARLRGALADDREDRRAGDAGAHRGRERTLFSRLDPAQRPATLPEDQDHRAAAAAPRDPPCAGRPRVPARRGRRARRPHGRRRVRDDRHPPHPARGVRGSGAQDTASRGSSSRTRSPAR